MAARASGQPGTLRVQRASTGWSPDPGMASAPFQQPDRITPWRAFARPRPLIIPTAVDPPVGAGARGNAWWSAWAAARLPPAGAASIAPVRQSGQPFAVEPADPAAHGGGVTCSSAPIWAGGKPCSDSSTARVTCRRRPRRSASSCSIPQPASLANTLTGRILITA
jgi:hypothetical protein